MSGAPVCHIPPVTTTDQPPPLAMPGVPSNAQPNLQSLTSTVNTLLQIIRALLGQSGSPGLQGLQGAAGQAGKQPKPTDFTQKSIVTNKVKIYQNNDPTTGNFVEVEVVNSLIMSNKNGETWTYKAPPGANGGG